MLQFVQIGVQMFDTHLMIRADDRAFKQAPHAFDAIGMNVANNPFLCGVINPSVLRVCILDGPVSGHFVGVDRFRVWCGVLVNELVKRGLSSMWNDLQPNLALALDGSDSDCLVSLVTSPMPMNFTADIGFIHFDNTSEKLAVNLAHGR